MADFGVVLEYGAHALGHVDAKIFAFVFVFVIVFIPAPRHVDSESAVKAFHGGANCSLKLVNVQTPVQGLQEEIFDENFLNYMHLMCN